MDTQSLARSLNELLLLSTLARSRMHGYQMALDVEERSRGFFTFNHGTLYPILHRLEKEGLIEGAWSEPGEGRARKEYGITPAGRQYLRELRSEWADLYRNLSRLIDDDAQQVRTSAA